MEQASAVTIQHLKLAVSRLQPDLYDEVVRGMTAIALAMRQEVTEVDFAAMASALEGYEPSRVAVAFARCKTELLFVPKPKEVIDRLPAREVQNKKPDMKLVREFYEPYDKNLRLHVYEYDDGQGDLNADRRAHRFRQVKLERISDRQSGSEALAQRELVNA